MKSFWICLLFAGVAAFAYATKGGDEWFLASNIWSATGIIVAYIERRT